MAKRRLLSLAAILMATLFLSVAGALSAIGGVSQTPAANAVPGTGGVAVVWAQDTLCNSGEVQYWVNDFTHAHTLTQTAVATVTGAGPYTWSATIPTQSSGDVVEYQLHNSGTCPDEINNNAG